MGEDLKFIAVIAFLMMLAALFIFHVIPLIAKYGFDAHEILVGEAMRSGGQIPLPKTWLYTRKKGFIAQGGIGLLAFSMVLFGTGVIIGLPLLREFSYNQIFSLVLVALLFLLVSGRLLFSVFAPSKGSNSEAVRPKDGSVIRATKSALSLSTDAAEVEANWLEWKWCNLQIVSARGRDGSEIDSIDLSCPKRIKKRVMLRRKEVQHPDILFSVILNKVKMDPEGPKGSYLGSADHRRS